MAPVKKKATAKKKAVAKRKPSMDKMSSYAKEDAKKSKINSMERITKVLDVYVQKCEKVAKLEADLKEAKSQVAIMVEQDIPQLFEELGMEECKTDRGDKIKIKENMFFTVGKDNKEECFEWLRENGLGDIIKNNVSLTMDDEEYEKLYPRIKKAFDKYNLDYDIDPKVHAGTLKATLKEVMEQFDNGESDIKVPEELFKLYRKNVAEIRLKK